jgi:hypothetical protein
MLQYAEETASVILMVEFSPGNLESISKGYKRHRAATTWE